MVKLRQVSHRRRRKNVVYRKRRTIAYKSKITNRKQKLQRRIQRHKAIIHVRQSAGIQRYDATSVKQSATPPVPALVTFIEKPGLGQVLETALDQPDQTPTRFHFQLERGRLNVPQVLHQLGITRLQYEHQPGVWRALQGLRSGKSIDKFQKDEEVFFRTSIAAAVYDPEVRESVSPGWSDHWYVDGDTEEAYNARVSRLTQKTAQGRIGIGTIVRVQSQHLPGLMLTCRHCVVANDDGDINDKLIAFGGKVKVLYVSSKFDLAICDGPPGTDGFRLAETGEEEKGREIRMLSFPYHVDLVYGLFENVGPTQVHGHVCMFSPERCEVPMEVDSLGTYMGGFPASSGGAVTLNSRTLCGIHVGVLWHEKEDFCMPLTVEKVDPNELNTRSHLMDECAGSQETRCQEIKSGRPKFRMELCGKTKKGRIGRKYVDCGKEIDPLAARFCSSSHGYLATYVSATHIEETFRDYFESRNASPAESSGKMKGVKRSPRL